MPARKLPDEAQKNLIDNNKKIGLLLMNNETILKENGFNPPAENFEFKDYKSKIRIPAGYVRKKDYYVQKYGLEKICDGNRDMIKNIAYSLQLTDFNNYIITRMGLFGSVLAMMHKQATINFVSIIEGLIKSYLATIWGKCKNCPRNETCSRKIIRKHKEGIFKNIIRVYKEYELLDLDDEIYDRILTLYRYRNSIHLTKLRSDDEEDLEDSISTHNEAVEKLKLIDDSMKSNIGFWYYGANCSGSKP